MPITSSAKKALRSSARKRNFNMRRKAQLRDVTKEYKSLAVSGKIDTETLSRAYKAIDKAAKRGIIKPNTAARKKSRLAKMAKS